MKKSSRIEPSTLSISVISKIVSSISIKNRSAELLNLGPLVFVRLFNGFLRGSMAQLLFHELNILFLNYSRERLSWTRTNSNFQPPFFYRFKIVSRKYTVAVKMTPKLIFWLESWTVIHYLLNAVERLQDGS